MALNSKTLADSITSAFATFNPTAIIPAQQVSSAIGAYVQGGMSNLGGAPISAPMIPALTSQLATIWSALYIDSITPAVLTATAINTAYMPIQIVGGTHGLGGFIPGSLQFPLLKEGLITAYANPIQQPNVFGQLFATAVDSFIKSGQTYSTGTPPDFVSSVGPLQ